MTGHAFWPFLLVLGFPGDVHAEPPSPLRSSMSCETPPGPGRFRCDVELRVVGRVLDWADVEVIAVDDSILPLRGRLGPRDAATREPDVYRWSLGFVARSPGAGTITVRVRAVLCEGQACDPEQSEISARVLVGP